MAGNNVKELNLLDLPKSALMDIFELLPYDTVAKNRQVCRVFNDIGGKVLNAGFNKVIRRHSAADKSIKALLPRRESERLTHSLIHHSLVLDSLTSRIKMMSITYGELISRDLCCFVPGLVLDEMNRLMDMIGNINHTFNSQDVLLELRDITSMAVEHFNEYIFNTMTSNSAAENENNINKKTFEEQPAIEDVLAKIKKIDKLQIDMKQDLKNLLSSNKHKQLQISSMYLISRKLSKKIKLMENRMEELESENCDLQGKIIRLKELENEKSLKSDENLPLVVSCGKKRTEKNNDNDGSNQSEKNKKSKIN